jgi:hypothetical protein
MELLARKQGEDQTVFIVVIADANPMLASFDYLGKLLVVFRTEAVLVELGRLGKSCINDIGWVCVYPDVFAVGFKQISIITAARPDPFHALGSMIEGVGSNDVPAVWIAEVKPGRDVVVDPTAPMHGPVHKVVS